jgi:hypothetical protein
MKKELNFLQSSVDCKGKFSGQKFGRRDIELPLNTKNQPLMWKPTDHNAALLSFLKYKFIYWKSIN